MWAVFLNYALAISIYEVPNIGNPAGYMSIGLPPQRRYSSAIAASLTHLYIYGGTPGDLDEIWEYDLSTYRWQCVVASNPSIHN